ncbi:MAG: hypothetical protein JW951_09235, partial [Lentisphaerae bacterium]|nr:hypothetical protein [Lentisphaerota bacterium]
QVSRRLAFYKACRSAGETHAFTVSGKAREAERAAAEQLRVAEERTGLAFDSTGRRVFLEKVGTDTRHIMVEAEKLAVYVGTGGRAGRDDVDAVVSPGREAIGWDLWDAIGERDTGRAVRVLRRLLFQGESVIGLLMGVAGRLRDLILYREALDQGWLRMQGDGKQAAWAALPPEVEAAFGDMGKDPRDAHPYYSGKLAAQARRFTLEELKRGLNAVIQANVALVSHRIGSPATVLELTLVRLTGSRSA